MTVYQFGRARTLSAAIRPMVVAGCVTDFEARKYVARAIGAPVKEVRSVARGRTFTTPRRRRVA